MPSRACRGLARLHRRCRDRRRPKGWLFRTARGHKADTLSELAMNQSDAGCDWRVNSPEGASVDDDRGGSAASPKDIPAGGWKDILLRVYLGISDHRILANAAADASVARRRKPGLGDQPRHCQPAAGGRARRRPNQRDHRRTNPRIRAGDRGQPPGADRRPGRQRQRASPLSPCARLTRGRCTICSKLHASSILRS